MDTFHDSRCLTLDAKGVGQLIGRSARSIERDDDEGRIPQSVRIGASRRWIEEEVRCWLRHGCPRREEWVRIWEKLRDSKQEQ